MLRFVDSGSATGSYNMALDEVLLASCSDSSIPVLRTYTWDPPAVSIGYGQRAEEILDLDECQRRGIDVVRRPTGGRAVLHWNELTYSFLSSDDHGAVAGSLEDSNCRFGECLVAGLNASGIDAELSPGTPKRCGKQAPCFSSTARWEVTRRGRKLVGSAQRRIRGGALQHGSILIGPEHAILVDVSRRGGDRQQLLDACAHLGDAGAVPNVADLAANLARGFARILGLAITQQSVSEEEHRQAEELARSKYASVDHLLAGRAHAA
ncbi:MAG: lipoate--protein ligase family protein [Candidatus Latescibacterota bacterium]|nr:lipoate--protein ligase family protein [Candidatus Latescibacterota bacterium]